MVRLAVCAGAVRRQGRFCMGMLGIGQHHADHPGHLRAAGQCGDKLFVCLRSVFPCVSFGKHRLGLSDTLEQEIAAIMPVAAADPACYSAGDAAAYSPSLRRKLP